MPLYRMMHDRLAPIERTDFAAVRLRERQDLQRLLRDQIDVIDRGLLVLCEEFGQWDNGNRRIDLLAIDRDANIVVIELKRNEHGGHMELQAIRYAAMVANMTFEQAVSAHASYLGSRGIEEDAEQRLLEFLGWDDAGEQDFGTDTRIVLVSGDFSRELTTAVLWLNEKGLDIRCVRLRPHKLENDLVLQVEQVLPLPEAQDYVVKVREKQRSEAEARSRDLTRFTVEIDGHREPNLAKRQAIARVMRRLCAVGATPEELANLSGRSLHAVWRSAEGDLSPGALEAELLRQAAAGGPAFDPGRWFLESDFLVHSGGRSWTFTKMWGVRTEQVMRTWLGQYPEAGVKLDVAGD